MINRNTDSGIGFVGLLTIVFIVLKLLGNITWSWFWVLSPMIFSMALGLVILILIVVIALFVKYNKKNKKK